MQIIKHFFCKFGEKNRTFLDRCCIGNNLDIIPMKPRRPVKLNIFLFFLYLRTPPCSKSNSPEITFALSCKHQYFIPKFQIMQAYLKIYV